MARGKKKEDAEALNTQISIENTEAASIQITGETIEVSTIEQQPTEETIEASTETSEAPNSTETEPEESNEQGPDDISKDAQRLDNDSQLGQKIPDELRDKLGCDGEKTDSEALIEKAEETLKGEEQLEEALRNNDTDAAKEILEAELKKAEEIKNELKKDIEKKEEEIKKQRRFRKTFGGFWNGVSSGWED